MGIRVNAALNQFNNGLVSPELEARTEMQVAAYSCRQLENASVEVAGGVHRRGGSVYVKTTAELHRKRLGPMGANVLAGERGYPLRVHKRTIYRFRPHKNNRNLSASL